MSKIAIFSDLHLGVHQNSDFWLNQSEKWVDWFIEDISKKNIQTVYFLGDYFHERDAVSVKTLHHGSELLRKFYNFHVTMIPGNHDCFYKDNSNIHSLSIFKTPYRVKVCSEIVTESFEGKELVFCPWGTKLNEIPKADVVFGHFELKNFRFNAHHICETGDDPEELLLKSKLIFSGHFHSRDVHRFGDRGEIIMVGNPFEMDFGDAYQRKGYHILDTDTLTYEFVENTWTPKHIVMYLSKLITLKNIDIFQEALPNNIIKLVVDKNISTEHLDLLLGKMSSYGPSDLRVDHDVNYNKIQLTNEDEVHDLSGVSIEVAIEEFVQMLDVENKKEVVEYAIGLMQKST